MLKEAVADGFMAATRQARRLPFAIALYLDGAKRHLSKIGRWNRRRIRPSSATALSQTPVRSFASATSGSAGCRWLTMWAASICGSSICSDLRRQGIGTRLIKDLLRGGDAQGRPVTLDVMHGNPARRLYLRLGFRQNGQDADRKQMIWRPPRG